MFRPNLHTQNVKGLYRVSRKFEMTMEKMLNLIVAVAIEELENAEDIEAIKGKRTEELSEDG